MIFSSSSNEKSLIKSLGDISCIYNAQSLTEQTLLIGANYKKNSNFLIYINDNKEPFKFMKEYKFSSLGEHIVKYAIFEDLFLDYLFQDIPDLISVNFTINNRNKIKILSMQNLFSGCISLSSLYNQEGFDFSKVKFLHKLFNNCSYLNEKNVNISLKANNVEDLSYICFLILVFRLDYNFSKILIREK